MEALTKSTGVMPVWLALSLMAAGCLGLVAASFAWSFGSGPLPTPWFMALFTLCAVTVAVATTTSASGVIMWCVLILGFNVVMFTSHVRAAK